MRQQANIATLHTSNSCEDVNLYRCSICNRAFDIKYNQQQHEAACARKMIRQQENMSTLRTSTSYEEVELFRCSICNRDFNVEYNRQQHEVACARQREMNISTSPNEDVSLFQCNKCNRSFQMDYNRQQHENACGRKLMKQNMKTFTKPIFLSLQVTDRSNVSNVRNRFLQLTISVGIKTLAANVSKNKLF